MKIAFVVLLLFCSALANNVVNVNCKQNQGNSFTQLYNGGGFKNFIYEGQGTCVDTKWTISFICGASEFKCIGGCLEKVVFEHQQGA